MDDAPAPQWDYIVVGSGAGGGTVAARLAEYGHSVLLLEAGPDPRAPGPRLPDDYDVPAFHSFASENAAIAWDFYVEHFDDPVQQAKDWRRKLSPQPGILYPRASALGGCTAHNAMIFVRPDDADWEAIRALTGDRSWSARAMARYFRRLEDCRHRPVLRFLAKFGIDFSGHGWNGWLTTEQALPRQARWDPQMVRLLYRSAQAALTDAPGAVRALLQYALGRADPNARVRVGALSTRVWYTPLTTRGHARTGTRERVREVQRRLGPGRLEVRTGVLATKVLLDGEARARGVAFLEGAGLYRACKAPADGAPAEQRAGARREVILAGGAFNTPQLLMLSGIGPAADLRARGIEPRVDLPGVGRNLQDRYEVGLVYRLDRPWDELDGATFEPGDAAWRRWATERDGMYVSSGAALAVAKRSSKAPKGLRDLFFMGLLAQFRGYFPGYSKEVAAHRDRLTWAVLKARTSNRGGEVRLASNDPREPPAINFRNFGDPAADADLDAMVEAVAFARGMARPLLDCGAIREEQEPGPSVDTPDKVRAWVRDNAWGHHASCSCPIGRDDDPDAVLTSDFRVRGAWGLRVVDASIFPRIPGFFIAAAVYMAGEKAADVIHAAALAEEAA